MAHPWEGNVRELHNCVEYLAYLDQPVIHREDLPATILAYARERGGLSQEEPQPVGQAAEAIERLRRRSGQLFPVCCFILGELEKGASMGRKSLAAFAKAEGVSATEQNIRTALTYLEQQGLIEIRRGRAGSRLTPLGQEVLGGLDPPRRSAPKGYAGA